MTSATVPSRCQKSIPFIFSPKSTAAIIYNTHEEMWKNSEKVQKGLNKLLCAHKIEILYSHLK